MKKVISETLSASTKAALAIAGLGALYIWNTLRKPIGMCSQEREDYLLKKAATNEDKENKS